MIIAAGAWLASCGGGELSRVLALGKRRTGVVSFSFCGESARMNCVVDGDYVRVARRGSMAANFARLLEQDDSLGAGKEKPVFDSKLPLS